MEQRKVERLLLQIQKNQLDQQWKDFLHRLFYPPPPLRLTALRGTNKLHNKLANSLSMKETSLFDGTTIADCLL
nr:MAG TPA: hypothetical protein [Bacteriophage sp.]